MSTSRLAERADLPQDQRLTLLEADMDALEVRLVAIETRLAGIQKALWTVASIMGAGLFGFFLDLAGLITSNGGTP